MPERAKIPAIWYPCDVDTSQLSDFGNLPAAVELCSDKHRTKEKSSAMIFPRQFAAFQLCTVYSSL